MAALVRRCFTSVLGVTRAISCVSAMDRRALHYSNVLGSKASDLGKMKIEPLSEGCPVCSRNITFTHKDVLFLAQFLSPDGYILNRRKTGVCKRQQRRIATNIAMARRLGILPNFVAKDKRLDN